MNNVRGEDSSNEITIAANKSTSRLFKKKIKKKKRKSVEYGNVSKSFDFNSNANKLRL